MGDYPKYLINPNEVPFTYSNLNFSQVFARTRQYRGWNGYAFENTVPDKSGFFYKVLSVILPVCLQDFIGPVQGGNHVGETGCRE